MSQDHGQERNLPTQDPQGFCEWLVRKFRQKKTFNKLQTCILHIGPHKTGSTSIQLTLHKGREILEKYGAYYLNTDSANHSWLICSAFASKQNLTYHRAVKQGKNIKYDKYDRKSALKILESRIINNKHPLFIISAEDIAAFTPDELIQLKKFLDARFNSTVIVGFVRPPMSFVNSYAQQILQSKGTYDDLCNNPPVANYRQYFEKFFSIWGDDNVILKPFAKSHFSNGCIVSEFLQMVGLDNQMFKELTIYQSNQSISMKAAKLVSLFREKSNSFDFDKNTKLKICNKLLKLEGSKFFLPSLALEKSLLLSEKDIKWMQGKINCQLSDFDYKPRDLKSSLPQSDVDSYTDDDLNALLKEITWQT
jgi:hypothetical protein